MRSSGDTRIEPSALRCFSAEVLKRVGTPPQDAEQVADCLVEGDLRGIAGHGSVRLLSYLERIRQGGCNPKADVRVVRDGPATALVDGDGGFGEVAGVRAMGLAVEKARTYGIGSVLVRNSGPFGAAAYFPMIAVRNDMIGFTTLSTTALIPPPGGLRASIGNSPMAFGIPAGEERPILLDMALTVASRAKCRTAAMEGRKIPRDWAVTNEGKPTEDPIEAIEGLLLPIAGYKGYGLAIVMGALTGVLSGGPFGASTLTPDVPSRVPQTSHYYLALNVASYLPVEEFKSRVDRLIRQQRSVPTVAGHGPVHVPGEMAWLRKEACLRDGIPMGGALLAELRRLGEGLGITGIAC